MQMDILERDMRELRIDMKKQVGMGNATTVLAVTQSAFRIPIMDLP